MKRFVCITLFALSGLASAADDLAEANRLLAAQSYDQALPIYQRLADAGNPEAQMRLGEMYWFGDGTTADLGKAKTWFEKSAAAGNADAVASLASLKRRETHGDEIVYWTRTYDGADMVSGKFACKVPELPAASETKSQIRAVDTSIKEYSECYNGFTDNLNSAMPPGKRIPTEVLDMMTPAEAKLAQQHLDQVYARLSAEAKRDAGTLAARETAWREQTERIVAVDSSRNKERMSDMKWEQQRRQNYNSDTYRDSVVIRAR